MDQTLLEAEFGLIAQDWIADITTRHSLILREALINMGRADLIGTGPKQLIPPESAAEKTLQAPKGNARGGGGPGSVGKIPNRGKAQQSNGRNTAGAIPRGAATGSAKFGQQRPAARPTGAKVASSSKPLGKKPR